MLSHPLGKASASSSALSPPSAPPSPHIASASCHPSLVSPPSSPCSIQLPIQLLVQPVTALLAVCHCLVSIPPSCPSTGPAYPSTAFSALYIHPSTYCESFSLFQLPHQLLLPPCNVFLPYFAFLSPFCPPPLMAPIKNVAVSVPFNLCLCC